MVTEIKSVGAIWALETLLGEDKTGRWVRPIVRNWGFIYLGFVASAIWLPSRATPAEPQILRWILTYSVYLSTLEILSRVAKRSYEGSFFRLFRIHFNLVMILILALVAPPTASSYLWFLLSMSLLVTTGYFGRSPILVVVYLEVCIALLLLTFARGWPDPFDLATMIAKVAILGLMATVFYFFVHLFPRLREENTLREAATTLIRVLDQRELCQLLAETAKEGIPTADAVVVHLMGGEKKRTLIPLGSSNIDLTTLGRSLMEVGIGIAGQAIQNRETINVPDVDQNVQYHRFSPSLFLIKSLLVAPMHVGDKNIGTVSVHSAKREAFGERDERFLSTLAAQGAMAIANAELYDTRKRRRQQIADILEASRTFSLNQSLNALLNTIAEQVCRCSGYQIVVVNLLDESSEEVVVRAMAGVPPAGRRKLEALRIPHQVIEPLFRDEFRVSQSYFIRHDRCPKMSELNQYSYTPDLGERKSGEWHQEDMLIVPIQTQKEDLLGYISVDDPSDRQLPSLDTIQALEILASVAATAIQNAHLYEQAQQEIAERKRAEERLAREQRLLQTFMDNVPDHIYFKDTDSRFIRINKALASWFSLDDPAQALSKTDFDFFTHEHAQQAYVDEQEVMRTGQPISKEEKETWPDGRETWVSTTKMPHRDEKGNIGGTFGISKDITDRKQRETRLQEYLSTVTNNLALHTSLEGLYRFIVETGTKLLPARDCFLFLVSDEDNNILELVETTASSPRADRPRISISTDPGCGLVAHVAAMRQPIRLVGAEIAQHQSWNGQLWKELGWDFDAEAKPSVLAVPMHLPTGLLVGVLAVRGEESSESFVEFDEALLNTLATNAAADIQRVRGLEKAGQEAVHAERKRLEAELHEAMNVLATGVRWEAETLSEEIEKIRQVAIRVGRNRLGTDPHEELNVLAAEVQGETEHSELTALSAARVALTRLQAAFTRAYTDLRYLLADLRDPSLEQEGLLLALKKRAELIGHERVVVYGNLQERLPPEIEGILYRVGQEAMSNAVKHSGVVDKQDVKIEVGLERGDGEVKLWVKDNGTGFDVGWALALSHKWGLRRLRDIVHEIGGKLEIASEPRRGTTICAIIDLTRWKYEQ